MGLTFMGGEVTLIITADDYGYSPAYNAGILEAARGRAVDAVSAMVGRRWCDPEPLLATGVEVGLHLELPPGASRSPRRAGPAGRDAASERLRSQLERFERLFGRPPGHLDGHHHCHARAGLAAAVARIAAERGLPLRSVDARHRRVLRRLGALTPDLLIGRLAPSEPALPAELQYPGALPSGVTEWMVHPGHRDPRSGSSYDAAREEDLRLLLGLSLGASVRRRSHREALRATPAG
jgi:predicted glycoside hydrolase/deacetylase ChbG (UPF0249 family)